MSNYRFRLRQPIQNAIGHPQAIEIVAGQPFDHVGLGRRCVEVQTSTIGVIKTVTTGMNIPVEELETHIQAALHNIVADLDDRIQELQRIRRAVRKNIKSKKKVRSR